MATLQLSTANVADLTAEALVVFLLPSHGEQPAVALNAADLPGTVADAVNATITAMNVCGKADEVTVVPHPAGNGAVLVLTGIGKKQGQPHFAEFVRRAAAAALRSLTKKATVAVVAPTDEGATITAVAEGALMGTYAFTTYKKPPTEERPEQKIDLVVGPGSEKKTCAGRCSVVAQQVARTKDLVNTPPLDLFPESFAKIAEEQAAETGCDIKVWDHEELREQGFGGLTGVGQGSSRPPRLVRISHAPAGATKHVALVGKGVTFDTGGVCLKPSAGMAGMKMDMAGAAAVLNAVIGAARLNLNVKVTGWLCLAENMPSGTAIRPSDVLTIKGGKTVEIGDTDAEGRLVLADGLVSASAEHPDVIVDIATLTGAQMIALGTRVSGVMGNDEVCQQLVSAGTEAGEYLWQMPLPEELRSSLDSNVADISNIGERMGGMLTAGLFLREFVGKVSDAEDAEQIPWAHIDIAGPAFNDKAPTGYNGKGATGAGTRTLLQFIQNHAS